MKILALITLVLFQLSAMAEPIIGSVTKIRGDVTILEVGFREAKKAIMGQNITKEASVLTSEKSFIKITLLDKTEISLGPNSKMIINQTPADKVGLISLIKGKIRTEVVKDLAKTNSQEKFFVKTRSAAMGVRGTNFETMYNPENNITNLITFRGQVALVKTEEQNLNIHNALTAKDTVLVNKGTFAAISDNLTNATAPVKLSPVQYTRLKLNPEMSEEIVIPKEEFNTELKKTINEYTEISKDEIKNNNLATHDYDAKNQILRPTAGGVVDLKTGIYIPPTSDQKSYNSELNIFELKSEKGTISESGNYIPPEGIILDAKKGFVANLENPNAIKHEDLIRLNKEIAGQVNKPIKPRKEDLGDKSEDAYDKYFIKE